MGVQKGLAVLHHLLIPQNVRAILAPTHALSTTTNHMAFNSKCQKSPHMKAIANALPKYFKTPEINNKY